MSGRAWASSIACIICIVLAKDQASASIFAAAAFVIYALARKEG